MSRLKNVNVSGPGRSGQISVSGAVEHEGVVLPFEWRVHEDEDAAQHIEHVQSMKSQAERFVSKCGECRKHWDAVYPTASGSIVFTSVGLAYEGPEHWHMRAFWEERRDGSIRCRRREVTVGDPAAADPDALVAAIVAEYPAAAEGAKKAAKGKGEVAEKSGHDRHREALLALLT